MNKRKTATAVAVADPPDRQIAFRAPDVVHGGLKEIIGRLERVSYRIDGKSVSGQDDGFSLLHRDSTRSWRRITT